MKKESVRSLAEGAMIGAMYGILLILIRFLVKSPDAFIYYLLPIPIMIYVEKRGARDGGILLATLILLSFLIVTDPMYVLPLLLPNYLIGYIAGILEKYTNLKLINYLVVFVLCFLIDYLSIWAYAKIMGVDYFTLSDGISQWFIRTFNISEVLLQKIMSLTIPVVLAIDSACKLVIIYLIFDLICYRLKIKEDINKKNILRIKYNKWISITYIILFILSISIYLSYLTTDNYVLRILTMIFMSIVSLLSIYLIYQWSFFISLYLGTKGNKVLGIIIPILSILLFPIAILGGIISNFIGI